MTGRWANLALAVLVPTATASGFLMFLFGSGSPVWPVAVFHGAAALAIIVLVPWKRRVVQRGLARVTRPGRATSVALIWVVLVALSSGLAHVVGLSLQGTSITTMQLHVTAGILATVVTVVHTRQRPVRVRRVDQSRRALLSAGLVLGVAGVATAVVQGIGYIATGSGTRRATGSLRLASSRVDAIPSTSWLFDAVPALDAEAYRLTTTVAGATRTWSRTELAAFHDEVTAVLDCTGGWWTEQTWSGMRVARLVGSGVTTIVVTSDTGYQRRLPLTQDLLLATAVGGSPLDAGHGAPVRLVVPGRRGYHWVKWVTSVEVETSPWWLEPPLPLR
ncbi:molybdopterin-dependent oxidoreductase [Lapillicoccus sp.]|uniref:molybdopterin-dependent oxidoreductase n=1 Tax=Lapillicoccus sp. TaxID=1909287 RepID=UPI003266779F